MNKSELLEIINFYYNGTCILFNIFLERQSPFFFFFFWMVIKTIQSRQPCIMLGPKLAVPL